MFIQYIPYNFSKFLFSFDFLFITILSDILLYSLFYVIDNYIKIIIEECGNVTKYIK